MSFLRRSIALSLFHRVYTLFPPYCADNLTNSERSASGVDQKTLFAEEVLKATQKLPVVTGEILNISLKDFADLVVEEGAPFSYKW